MECLRCKVDMEQGFVPDFGTAATWVAVWVQGTPEASKSVWEPIKTGSGIGLGEGQARVIDAHRCPTCGKPELYATRAPELGSTPAARST